MSAASVLELATVTAASGPEVVDEFVRALRIDVLAVDLEHLHWARHALALFGRSSGSAAQLSFGDCLAYGAAKATDRPLLFTGEGFAQTDVMAALRPGG